MSNLIIAGNTVIELTAEQMNAVLAVVRGLSKSTPITSTPRTKVTTETKSKKTTATPKNTASKNTTLIVGSLEQDGVYVRTIKGAFISSKARYAIKMTATDMGATKLGKGDKVYDSLAKKDKYVQVYKFQSVADADKFMAEQAARMAK